MPTLLGDVNVRNAYPPQQAVKSATIAADASLSDAIDLRIDAAHSGPGKAVWLQMPASWTTAALSFAASGAVDGTYNAVTEIRRDGASAAADTNVLVSQELTIPAAAGQMIMLDPDWFRGMRFIKIRSGLVGGAVTQAAARTINVGVVSA